MTMSARLGERMTRLRPATHDDTEALSALALRSKAHWGYDEQFMERAAAELVVTRADLATRRVVLAEGPGGELLGFTSLLLDGPDPEIEMMFVEPAAIGTGVGRVLLGDALEAARAAGVGHVLVQSDPQAEGFYRAQGAERIGERESPSTGRSLPLLRWAL